MIALLLIGGGGHCRAAVDVIEAHGGYRIRGVVQPACNGVDPVSGYPVVGEDEDLPALLVETPYALVTVGQIKTAAIRVRLFERLKQLNAALPAIASPHAYVSRRAILEEGSLVMHGAVVNAGARIGSNAIINSLALVEHDAQIGRHCHVSTGARINGGAVVEDACFIGSGAVLRQGVRVGTGAVVGAGCVVARNVPPNSLVKCSGG